DVRFREGHDLADREARLRSRIEQPRGDLLREERAPHHAADPEQEHHRHAEQHEATVGWSIPGQPLRHRRHPMLPELLPYRPVRVDPAAARVTSRRSSASPSARGSPPPSTAARLVARTTAGSFDASASAHARAVSIRWERGTTACTSPSRYASPA